MRQLVERFAAGMDAALNPLTVKEAHQSFRNRSLLIMGFLVLGVPLLIFMGSAASSALTAGSDRAGEMFFRTLSGFLLFVTWFGVPARLAAQFHGEVKTRTIELTMLTGLSPWELASGHFQAGALQVVLLFAFISPFAVASIAMGGIGADRVLPELLMIFVVALMQCAGSLLAVTASALAPRLLALFALIGICELFTMVSAGITFTSMAAASGSALELLLWSVLISTITLFFVRLSADMLAPSGMRSYVRSKLLMVVLVLMYFALPLLGTVLSLSFSSTESEPFLFMGALWLCWFGVLWSGSDRRPGSAGKLGFVFEDGPEPTVLYVVLLLGLITLGAQRAGWESWIVLAFLVYFVLFVGLGALLQSLWFTHSAEGFFLGLLVAFATDVVVTFTLLAIGGWSFDHQPSRVTLLLPFVWATSQQRVLDPWTALPLLTGVGALLWARQRRRKRQHG